MRGLMMDFPLTVPALLERAGNIFGGVEIITRRPDRSLASYTWRDLYRRARRLANVLTGMGLQRGDRGATLLWNQSEHAEAYFCVPAAGGVLHTLNLRLHPDEISFIANHAGDRFLIVDDILLPVYEKFCEQVNFERVIVVPYPGWLPWLRGILVASERGLHLSATRRKRGSRHVLYIRHDWTVKGRCLFTPGHRAAFAELLRSRFVCDIDARYCASRGVHVPCEWLGNSVHCCVGWIKAGFAGPICGSGRAS